MDVVVGGCEGAHTCVVPATGPAFGLPVDLLPGKKHTDAGAAGSEKKMKKGKAAGMKALEVAQLSTASIGR